MIEVIHYQYEENERSFEGAISKYYDEARTLLPGLPEKMCIYFSNEGIIPETGMGGHAHNSEIITISIDPEFKDKRTQVADIRPTIFHESFHTYQNYTFEGPKYSGIESAIYEGMATVFERQYAGKDQPYGNWHAVPTEKLELWLRILSEIDQDEYERDWQQWKFYHEEIQERWIAYKLGVFIVDKVLSKQGVDITGLKDKTAKEVLDLYKK